MRPEKTAIAEDIRNRLASSEFVVLADYQGLTVEKSQDLRSKLREHDARMLVTKRRLLAHAARELSMKELAEAVPTGSLSMVYGSGDVVAVSKILKTFIKQNDLPVIKLGTLNGELLSAGDIDQLAGMPGRQEMLGIVVGTIAAPLSQMVGVLHQKLASLVYVLKAVQDKKEQGD
jgi:large subunit ribosomal protein L10